MFAMKLPKKLAVIKVKAHLTTNTMEAKDNALADVAAKQACSSATVQACSGSTAQKTILSPESVIDLYKDVPLCEAWTWLDKVDSSDNTVDHPAAADCSSRTPLQMPGVGLEWTGPNYHRLLHIKGT